MYNYVEEMKKDIRQYIKDEHIEPQDYSDKDDMRDSLNDTLWIEDTVTGNGCMGQYYRNIEDAKKAVTDNMELMFEALYEFGEWEMKISELAKKDWHWFDVTIRCYVLGNAIYEVMEEDYTDDEFEKEGEEDE